MNRFCNNCGKEYQVPIESSNERRRSYKSPFCSNECKREMDNKKRKFKRLVTAK